MSIHHPADEDAVIALVNLARDEGLKLRVCGSAHSVAHAIYADPLHGIENAVSQPTPADGPNMNVLLDVARDFVVRSQDGRLIEVDAGMPLGDWLDEDTGETHRGLLRRLYEDHRWMLSDTGGITHQTVAGFTATGSAGGSLTCSLNDDVCGFRLVDGTGTPRDIDEDDADFAAMVPNLGLLGVVTKVRFRCVPAFNIEGRQTTHDPSKQGVDLFGAGPAGRQSLREFLTTTPYGRVEWWPQRGAERARAWEAHRLDWTADFEPRPFKQFGKPALLDQIVVCVALTALGNLDDGDRVKGQLAEVIDYLEGRFELELLRTLEGMGELGMWLAELIRRLQRRGLIADVEYSAPYRRWIPPFFKLLLDLFAKQDAVETFTDMAWRGLPMDNEADDVLLPVEFTEIWVPLRRTEQVMKLLHDRLTAKGEDDREAYGRTGLFAIELYAEKANAFWLNPAYSDPDDPEDEWADGALRIDVYWYGRNPGDPASDFYPQFWDLLRNDERAIPFRLHWGKFLPLVERDPWWIEHIRPQYRHWDDFLALRKDYDPDDIFLNDYWLQHLGVA